MDVDILKLGGNSLIKAISDSLALDIEKVTLISETENFVYQYTENYILRVAPVSHRSMEELYAELEWINFLNSNGIHASRVVIVGKNKLVNSLVYAGIDFCAIFFEYAKGKKVIFNELLQGNTEVVDQFYKLWGKTVGRMHSIAKRYRPSNPSYSRKQWNQVIPKLIKEEDRNKYESILEKQQKIITYLSGLPKVPDSYGMIHSDFTYHNFFVCDAVIYSFDFDHCKYHWFVYDIAILLDSARYIPSKGLTKKKYINHFFDCFMEGYLPENTCSDFWIKQIPEFTKLWKIDNFIPIINKADTEKLKIWEEKMLKKLQRDIEMEIPYFVLE